MYNNLNHESSRRGIETITTARDRIVWRRLYHHVGASKNLKNIKGINSLNIQTTTTIID